MAKKATVEDLRTMFADTLCMYNNKPYYIDNINGHYYAECKNLLTQRDESILCDEKTFAAPIRRVGFVNVRKSVVYVERNPVRKYKAGLCRANVSFHNVPGVDYPYGAGDAVRTLYSLKIIEIADAIMGKYPTIEECITSFDNGTAAMAFDHQFALSAEGNVFYKENKVGKFKNDAKTPYDFVFDAKYKYLINLLDNNHEKSISAS